MRYFGVAAAADIENGVVLPDHGLFYETQIIALSEVTVIYFCGNSRNLKFKREYNIVFLSFRWTLPGYIVHRFISIHAHLDSLRPVAQFFKVSDHKILAMRLIFGNHQIDNHFLCVPWILAHHMLRVSAGLQESYSLGSFPL